RRRWVVGDCVAPRNRRHVGGRRVTARVVRHPAGSVRLARARAAELAGVQLATAAVVFATSGPNRKINRLAATTAAATPNTGATTKRDIVAPAKAPAHIVNTTLNRSFS